MQIKPRILIVFAGFEPRRRLQKALVVCLMYAHPVPGALCFFFLLLLLLFLLLLRPLLLMAIII